MGSVLLSNHSQLHVCAIFCAGSIDKIPLAEEKPSTPTDQSEDQAMTELAKIMKMKDAGDWQQMALNIRRVTARLDISKGKLDAEELDASNLPEQLKDISNIVQNTALEFLLTISETLLDEEQKQDSKEKNEITTSVGLCCCFRLDLTTMHTTDR